MNERIKELIEETVKTTLLEHSTEYVIISTQSESLGVQHVLSIPIEFCERFAELIISDCVDACFVASGTRWMAPPTQDQIVLDCVREIRLRFGIES